MHIQNWNLTKEIKKISWGNLKISYDNDTIIARLAKRTNTCINICKEINLFFIPIFLRKQGYSNKSSKKREAS